MKKMIIGISGAIGSFSEEAAEYYCQQNQIKEHELKFLISVENVLAALDNKEIDLGIFPIENSNGGIVYEAVIAMSKHIFNIEKFFEIDIRHCLIAKPGKNITDIKMIASHDQALKQCKMYLKRRWPDTELKEWADTADAVRAIKEGELPETTAAIASRKAAEIYGLDILEEGIQDLKFNFTTFLAVTKK
ncbi:MAG: prephenate dehydratase domain-containing protein [Patescibacteria group bacterium]|nr:prephenate dehydratase domain-containing protein [Patescibacteria group bacterium]